MKWRLISRTSFSVAITAAICALPIGLANAQIVTIDNGDPGFSVLSEQWSTANVGGQFGSDYRYRTTGTPFGAVEWRPRIATASDYQVSVWYRSTGVGRPDDARYTVNHAGGSQDVIISQQINGSQWFSVGDFAFDSGTTGSVALTSDAEPGKTIVADAVRFRALGGSATTSEMRACWLTQYQYLGKSEAQLRAIAQNILAGNMNTVYIAAYSGGAVYWPSRAYTAAGGNHGVPGFDMMAYLIDIFHDEGLKVGAWFEYGMALGLAQHPVALSHPDWLARDAGGSAISGENGGFVFLSPGHPDAMQLLEDMIRELAENYSFDDIQIDRFRWGRKVIGQGREYGYESATADLYQLQFGVAPPTNIDHPNWVTFREQLVNDAVLRCYNAVKTANTNITVSSAPTGSYGITQHMQRWGRWVENGYMDLVMPQMYMTSLSTFINELSIQMAQAPNDLDKLAVGFRALSDNDAALVTDQINYAKSQGIHHGCLWVYHQYSSQIAIQDEIDILPQQGEPWEELASNPFSSDRMLQIVLDNDDGSATYQETGIWNESAQPDFLKFGSRVADGALLANATFAAAIPKSGRYEVYVWYTASGNRNPAATYSIQHYSGVTDVQVDQRSGGGQWLLVGEYIFEASTVSPVVIVSNAGSGAGINTSADGVKLVLSGFALGDVDGDGIVDEEDFAVADGCITGPVWGGTISEACEALDFDDSQSIDLIDLAQIQIFWSQ